MQYSTGTPVLPGPLAIKPLREELFLLQRLAVLCRSGGKGALPALVASSGEWSPPRGPAAGVDGGSAAARCWAGEPRGRPRGGSPDERRHQVQRPRRRVPACPPADPERQPAARRDDEPRPAR